MIGERSCTLCFGSGVVRGVVGPKVCPACGGDGRARPVCGSCAGTGRNVAEVPRGWLGRFLRLEETKRVLVPCATCKGSGKGWPRSEGKDVTPRPRPTPKPRPKEPAEPPPPPRREPKDVRFVFDARAINALREDTPTPSVLPPKPDSPGDAFFRLEDSMFEQVEESDSLEGPWIPVPPGAVRTKRYIKTRVTYPPASGCFSISKAALAVVAKAAADGVPNPLTGELEKTRSIGELVAATKKLPDPEEVFRRKVDASRSPPSTFVQWKGTDLCADVYCVCGVHSHIDAGFVYFVRCPACLRVYALDSHVRLTEVEPRDPWPAEIIEPKDARAT